MAQRIPDDVFAQTLTKMGIATPSQISAAQSKALELRASNPNISLAEILVQQGIITEAMRENVERKVQLVNLGGHQKLGHYRLIRKIGEGGMGTVYLAEHDESNKTVALKVLPEKHSADSEFLTRFKREAQATGKLHHENIVSAEEYGEDAGTFYFAMEYCDGESLHGKLLRSVFLPWQQAVDVTRQAALGLQCAHENGFVHRDIKPANIMLTQSGRAKILDLGLTKNLSDLAQSFNTKTGVTLGTPHYISPEQAKGIREIDGRSDIYSLGATLYQLVTGRTPFDGSSPALIMMKHLTEELPNPRDLRDDIPEDLAKIIRKMMAKEPADRYENCAALITDLGLVLEGKPPSNIALDIGRSSVAMPTGFQGGLSSGPASAVYFPKTVETPLSSAAPAGTPAAALAPATPLLPAAPETSALSADALKRKKMQFAYMGAGAVALILVLVLIFSLSGKTREPAENKLPPPPSAVPPAPPVVAEQKPEATSVIDKDWAEKTKALDGKARVNAVIEKLEKLNPEFKLAKWTYSFDSEGKEVISVAFEADSGVTNISPIVAFPNLEGLAFNFDPIRDKALLKEFKQLRTVNNAPVAEVLERTTPMASSYALNYDKDWLAAALALSIEPRIKVVVRELLKLNPGTDANMWSFSYNTSSTEIQYVYFAQKSGAKNFTPLLAFPKLTELTFDYDPARDKLLLKEFKELKKVNGEPVEKVLQRDTPFASLGKPK